MSSLAVVDTWYSLVPCLIALNFFEDDLTGLVNHLNKYNLYLSIGFCLVSLVQGSPLENFLGKVEKIHSRTSSSNGKIKTKKVDGSSSFFRLKLVALIYGFIGTLLAFQFIHLSVWLFGAFTFKYAAETIKLSSTMALLIGFPTGSNFIHDKMDQSWINTKRFRLRLFLILLGCWIGSISLPLDWQLPWLVWPFPCLVGSLAFNLLFPILYSFTP